MPGKWIYPPKEPILDRYSDEALAIALFTIAALGGVTGGAIAITIALWWFN